MPKRALKLQGGEKPQNKALEKIHRKLKWHSENGTLGRLEPHEVQLLVAEQEGQIRDGEIYYDPIFGKFFSVGPPDPIPAGETLDTLVGHWEACRKTLLASESWATLRDVLTRHLTTNAILKITSVVCVALGSLSGHDSCVIPGHKGTTHRSLYQLIELLSVLELFGLWRSPVDITAVKPNSDTPGINETLQKAIPIYAQEPRFNDLDRELLTRLGITVVENPDIWDMIDSETMAYSPGGEAWHIFRIAMMEPPIWWPVTRSYMNYVKQRETYGKSPPFLDETTKSCNVIRFPEIRKVYESRMSERLLRKRCPDHVDPAEDIEGMYVRGAAQHPNVTQPIAIGGLKNNEDNVQDENKRGRKRRKSRKT